MDISQERITANRQNARKSTGPRTSAGKRQSSQNARKHGLSVHGGVQEADVAILARKFVGEDADAARLLVAGIAAQAELEFQRICAVRESLKDLLTTIVNGDEADKRAATTALQKLMEFDRFERRELARRDRALRLLL
jgi:hypothetical protein